MKRGEACNRFLPFLVFITFEISSLYSGSLLQDGVNGGQFIGCEWGRVNGFEAVVKLMG